MRRCSGLVALLLTALGCTTVRAQQAPVEVPVTVDAPAAVLDGSPFAITLTVPEGLGGTPFGIRTADGEEIFSGMLEVGDNPVEELVVRSGDQLPLSITGPGFAESVAPRFLPGWLSLLPPIVAIALALIFREVIISLFAGIWLGAFFAAGLNPFGAILTTLDTFILGSLANDPDRLSIVFFSLLLGGMVGVITRSGGTIGIVEALRPYATDQRRGQAMTWFSGLFIFFDDYANTLIIGNSMRPVTDRLRISREKLAYIVDSTSAPVASIALISTWVGFEISLIESSLESAAAQVTDAATRADLLQAAANPFNVFVETIPYRFYPIFALAFVLMVALSQRDFGPMLRAERRANRGEGVLRPGSTPVADPTATVAEPPEHARHRWYNAALPVFAVIVVALTGIVATGLESLGAGDHAIWDIVGAGDAFRSLLWASFTGSVLAIALAVTQKILSLKESIDSWMDGMRAMLLAIVILVLAWGLGGVTEALGTGTYLADLLGETLPPRLLPVLVFLVAAVMSFATGTSWGTMAILFPVVVPLSVAMGVGASFDQGEHYTILLGAISSILAGSIFGDHCSPISDTTVLSSMACACDHIDHVRTQLPYALVPAVIGMTVGDIPTAWGLSPWVSIVVGLVLLYVVLRILGKRSDVEEGAPLELAASPR